MLVVNVLQDLRNIIGMCVAKKTRYKRSSFRDQIGERTGAMLSEQ